MKILNISNSQSFFGTKINAAIYNDMHGAIRNLDAFSEARDKFYKEHDGEANLTLSGGDVFLDKSPNNAAVASKLLSTTDAIALGNHDIEGGGILAA